MNNLKGKWVVVTGASRGIGLEVARALAKEGCNLFLCSRNIKHTKEIEEEAKEHGVSAISLEVQLEQSSSICELLKQIDEYEKEISVVYNIAAVNCNVLDFFRIPENYYRTTFNTNYFAPVQIMQHFIPQMLKNGNGRIICAGSDAHNEPKALPYIASKQALRRTIDELAFACNGTDLMINMVDPGWCKTDMGTDNAPCYAKDSAMGFLLAAALDDGISGRYFYAQEYKDYSLKQAYEFEMAKRYEYENQDGYRNIIGKVISLDDFVNKYSRYIESPKRKIIFGGGNQARFYLDIFNYLGCRIDCVVCSNRHGMSEIMGIPLYELNNCPFSKDECEIVIAITEAHIMGVEKQLKEEGFDVYPSFSILYSDDAWTDKEGKLISNIYTNMTNTFLGGKL